MFSSSQRSRWFSKERKRNKSAVIVLTSQDIGVTSNRRTVSFLALRISCFCIVIIVLCANWPAFPRKSLVQKLMPVHNCHKISDDIMGSHSPLPTLGKALTSDEKSHQQQQQQVGLLLEPYTLEPLPLGSIKPEGWMKDQLQLMADGLAGHQYDFYPIVKHSPWIGGHSEYSPLNEGLPYWFNGLVPLAYALNDSRLQYQVFDVVDKVLALQYPDGWLGPEPPDHRDIWARFPFCLGLMQLVQAEPGLASKILPPLHKFISLMHRLLAEGNAYWDFWGTVRYADMITVLEWLYEYHPMGNEDMLLESMNLLKRNGFNWSEYWTESHFLFADLDTVEPPILGDTFKYRHSHSVNVAQGLSAGAALYRFMKNDSLLQANRRGVYWTYHYHGDPAGSIIGDERESGTAPNRGSELCAAVEAMYSLSYLYQVMGDNEFAERCEMAAYNALPASIKANHWGRSYLVVSNAPFAKTMWGPNPYYNTGPDSLVHGIDPNYPCCTVNMPQGLPKFLSASYVRVGKDGIGHALLGPGTVNTSTASGISINITCLTRYPFNHTLKYHISSSGAFTLHVRTPTWARYGSSISLPEEGTSFSLSPDPHTGMTPIPLEKGTHTVIYNIDTDIRVVERGNSSVAIHHGAMLYALDVGQDTNILSTRDLSPNITHDHPNSLNLLERSSEGVHHSYNPEEDYPPQAGAQKTEYMATRKWNVGIDTSTLQFHYTAHTHKNQSSHSASQEEDATEAEYEGLPNPVFEYHAPPTYITAKGCEVDWPLFRGMPAALPALPQGIRKRQCAAGAKVVELVLRPYGSLKVRMAELPVVDLRSAGTGELVEEL